MDNGVVDRGDGCIGCICDTLLFLTFAFGLGAAVLIFLIAKGIVP